MVKGPVPRVLPGRPEPLGLTLEDGGANMAVFSEQATAVQLCLFDAAGEECARLELPGRTGSVWHGFVPAVAAGQHYGLRAEGPFAPDEGQRFNPAKLLLDPYASALTGPVVWSPPLQGACSDDPGSPDPRDSAAVLPKCIATAALAPIDPGERPDRPWDRTVIYEAHAKGLTRLWPGLDPDLAGRIPALALPEVIGHMKGLGVTAIELLPLHAFMTERRLSDLGLRNYWGYNSVSFFAPDPRLLGPEGLPGLRRTVRALHDAGIEVLLDVVYNHSGEGDEFGPTLSFRGLDNRAYYRLEPEAPAQYVNDTGCGNSLDLAQPFVLRLVLDSLRWWAQCIGVDGFRFDLAPALLRGASGFEPGSAFLQALLQDPILRGLKLIAEPWDIGPEGYRLGSFPAPFAEWNDRFRDAARGFWLGRAGAAAELGDGLLGSARVFDRAGRPAWSSINFVSCHDGLTLADLTAYAEKHNEANGEANGDGHDHNLSENFGVEGASADPAVAAARERRQRNLLATLLLAQGVPMLRAGDEIGQSQRGNNNAYCQDNEISWIDWASGNAGLQAFLGRLLALRSAEPALRQAAFLHGEPREADGLATVEWSALDGGEIDWEDALQSGLRLLLRGQEERWILVAINPSRERAVTVLAELPGRSWTRLLDSGEAEAAARAEDAEAVVAAESMAVFLSAPLTSGDSR